MVTHASCNSERKKVTQNTHYVSRSVMSFFNDSKYTELSRPDWCFVHAVNYYEPDVIWWWVCLPPHTQYACPHSCWDPITVLVILHVPTRRKEPLAFRAGTTLNTKHPLNVCTRVCATTSDMFADLVSSWILTSSRPSCTRKQILKTSHTFSCTRWRKMEIRNGSVRQGNHRYSTCHFKQLFKIWD